MVVPKRRAEPGLHLIWCRVLGLEPAADTVVWSFPQANAFVWKVDAGNAKKILDVVVFC